jgi:hypothetical protein
MVINKDSSFDVAGPVFGGLKFAIKNYGTQGQRTTKSQTIEGSAYHEKATEQINVRNNEANAPASGSVGTPTIPHGCIT